MSSYLYRNSHYKVKVISRPSYIYNGNPDTQKIRLYVAIGPFRLGEKIRLYEDALCRHHDMETLPYLLGVRSGSPMDSLKKGQ